MALITEWDFLNSNGGNDLVEVYLAPGEDPADFVFSVYERDGDLRVEIPLTGVGTVVPDPNGAGSFYIVQGSDLGLGNFWLDGLGTGANNTNSAALVDVSGPSNQVVSFFTTDRDPDTAAITPTTGAAAGFTSTALEAEGLNNNSYNWDLFGNGPTLAAPNSGSALCFAADTLIDTPQGPRRAGALCAGDFVSTKDNGPQKLLWVGKRVLSVDELRANPHWAPVEIAPGALGPNQPNAPLTVSPEHRLVLQEPGAEVLFNRDRILVAAHQLLGRAGVRTVLPDAGVVYVHLMCTRHEILFANGAPAESFRLDPQTLAHGDRALVAELRALFPQIDQAVLAGQADPGAGPILRGKEPTLMM